ncbi:hypothetical protein [Buttiauxella agrestis]|uniref:hypothetical protein n=1 Tax=Buttiauxella agrestis TaxID=82977 RepID=UPI003974ACAE
MDGNLYSGFLSLVSRAACPFEEKVDCGTDKSGRKYFYFDLIRKADEQFSRHLAELEKNK